MCKINNTVFYAIFLLSGVCQCFCDESAFKGVKIVCTFADISLSLSKHETITNGLQNTCAANSSHKINLSFSSRVDTIFENSVINLPNLHELYIVNVGLKEILPSAIKNVPRLENLYLSYNKMKEIKTATFGDLSVSKLILQNNSISTLRKKAFQNLPLLMTLDLTDNDLKEIKKDVFYNISIWTLDLRNNHISKIEVGAFGKIYPKLGWSGIKLLLSNNNLEEINPDVFKLEDLRYLDLDGNSISRIRRGDLANLPNLLNIRLSGNKLQEVPEGVFNGSLIWYLDLSHNEISFIASGAFDSMVWLLEVLINNNKLKIWDNNWFRGSWIGNWQNERTIFLSFNRIEELPDEAFKNLKKPGFVIELQKNGIKRISDRAFDGLKELKCLNLSQNEISEWSEKLVNSAKVIETVDLTQNSIVCTDIASKDLRRNGGNVEIEECM